MTQKIALNPLMYMPVMGGAAGAALAPEGHRVDGATLGTLSGLLAGAGMNVGGHLAGDAGELLGGLGGALASVPINNALPPGKRIADAHAAIDAAHDMAPDGSQLAAPPAMDPTKSAAVQAVLGRMPPRSLHKIAGAMYGIGEVDLRAAVLHLCTKMAHDHLRAMRVQHGLESFAALSNKTATLNPTVAPRVAREALEAARNAAAHAPTPVVSAVSGLPRYATPASLPAMSDAEKLLIAAKHNIHHDALPHLSHISASPFDWGAKPLPMTGRPAAPPPTPAGVGRKARPTLEHSNDLGLMQDFMQKDLAAGTRPQAAAAPKRFNIQEILGKEGSYTLEEILADNVKLAAFIRQANFMQTAKNLGTTALNTAKNYGTIAKNTAMPMARSVQQAAMANPTAAGAALGAGVGAAGGAMAGGEGHRLSGAAMGAGAGAGLGAGGVRYAPRMQAAFKGASFGSAVTQAALAHPALAGAAVGTGIGALGGAVAGGEGHRLSGAATGAGIGAGAGLATGHWGGQMRKSLQNFDTHLADALRSAEHPYKGASLSAELADFSTRYPNLAQALGGAGIGGTIGALSSPQGRGLEGGIQGAALGGTGALAAKAHGFAAPSMTAGGLGGLVAGAGQY